jgi:hypothetical protein
VLGRGGVAEQQRTLAEVVQHQRRERHAEPGRANDRSPEVTEIGVDRLGAGGDEEHAAQHDDPADAMVAEETDRPRWIEGGEDGRGLHDRRDSQGGEHDEPQESDRTEQRAEAGGPVSLRQEQSRQNRQRNRHGPRSKARSPHLDPLDGGQHRDGRCDDAVSVEERRGEETEREEDRSAAKPERARPRVGDERHQREDPPLAPIVRAQDDDHVLDRNDEDQRPDDEGQDPEHVGWAHRDRVRSVEALAQRVERARSDVAVDDAQRREPQGGRGPGAGHAVLALGFLACDHDGPRIH